MLWYRVFAMAVVFILLLVAINLAGASATYSYGGYRTNYESTTYPFDTPARCAWIADAFKHPAPDAVFATCVLVLGFVSRVVRLFDGISSACDKWLRTKPDILLQGLGQAGQERAKQSTNSISRAGWRIATAAVISIYIFGKALRDCVGSTLSQLLWLSFSLLYGTVKIFAWRSTSAGVELAENAWGFGQVIPLLMLIQPLMAVPELFAGKVCFYLIPDLAIDR